MVRGALECARVAPSRESAGAGKRQMVAARRCYLLRFRLHTEEDAWAWRASCRRLLRGVPSPPLPRAVCDDRCGVRRRSAAGVAKLLFGRNAACFGSRKAGPERGPYAFAGVARTRPRCGLYHARGRSFLWPGFPKVLHRRRRNDTVWRRGILLVSGTRCGIPGAATPPGQCLSRLQSGWLSRLAHWRAISGLRGWPLCALIGPIFDTQSELLAA